MSFTTAFVATAQLYGATSCALGVNKHLLCAAYAVSVLPSTSRFTTPTSCVPPYLPHHPASVMPNHWAMLCHPHALWQHLWQHLCPPCLLARVRCTKNTVTTIFSGDACELYGGESGQCISALVLSGPVNYGSAL